MVTVGMLGLGNVGTGVMRLLERNRRIVAERLGSEIFVKKVVVRDLAKPRDIAVDGLITDRAGDVLDDEDISVVVEVIGGDEPAYSYIKRAISLGKHVVTANKQVIAQHGRELMRAALEAGVKLLFEASVGGGIPVIRPIQECLAANEITTVMGILNGTTNYILTRMEEQGLEFERALDQARALGYAESDPTDDLSGADAARKLAILASLAFDTEVTPEQIETRGLERVSLTDMKRAAEHGYVVKLVAYAARKGDAVEACVSPALLPKDHPLAHVKDVFNAIMLEGEPVGRVVFYGRGAGGDPTASAVVSDVMEAARIHRVPAVHLPRQKTCRVVSPQDVAQMNDLPVWGA